ncbi:MAG: hypothetical protein D6701_06485 [Gemmatimonadetes bacterium]|nr:MAG: hypothetical protein D6701_06485 [Gemmatimonadota bacterium]
MASLGFPGPLEAQDPASIPEHFYKYVGCYELLMAAEPEWASIIERRVALTTIRLATAEDAHARQFVARAAPGETTSWYPKVYWLLAGDVGPLRIGWEWPAFDRVRAVFGVEDWDGESPLHGELSHSTDVTDYDPEPIAVRLVIIQCGDRGPWKG